jgi:hypothetical protein
VPLRRIATCLTLLACGVVALPATASADIRYSPAQQCWAIQDAASGKFLAKQGSAYTASAGTAAAAEPFHFQATALARYLLFGKAGDFLAANGGAAQSQPAPGGDADWKVEPTTGEQFTLVLPESGQRIAIAPGGAVNISQTGTPLTLAKATGCATYPEAEVNVTGTPYQGRYDFGETKGLIETHLHGMAFESFGGSLHCGRPFHPYGITHAMVDCPDHGPNGQGAAAENFLAYGDPTKGHDTGGWPTFKGWPHYKTYVHEQTYYKGLERAWRAGLRLYTNLLVDNAALCKVYPLKRNTCNEMQTIRLQVADLMQMIDYIDAQSGGPGKGWLRLVKSPFEARKVINDGKLALIMGLETSVLFDCGEYNHVPTCTRESMDAQFDEFHKFGVRQMELVNKFDNALTGVTGDDGTFGVITNTGNKEETGHYWAMETCMNPTAQHDHDKEQTAQSDQLGRDALLGGVLALFGPPQTVPAYPQAPHCNQQGLTALGAHLLRRMAEKGVLFDPDHMSVIARDQALSVMESLGYAGVMSSHSWSTPDAYKRIMAVGGVVTPASKSTQNMVKDVAELRTWRNKRYLFGTGFSTDMNGFASQGAPRPDVDKTPLVYPFRSMDGSVMVDKNKMGERVYDLNKDGTAHFGLYADRVHDIGLIGGEEMKRDLLNGAEAYIQTWERAEGVKPPTCRAANRRFTTNGMGEIRLGHSHVQLLKSAGQPESRPGRVWTYCANGTRTGNVKVTLTPAGTVALVTSTAPYHRARSFGRGAKVSRVLGFTKAYGRTLRVGKPNAAGNRVVYGVRKGKVTFAGMASRTAAKTKRSLAAYVKLAGL